MKNLRVACALMCAAANFTVCFAQDSAPSSHLFFNDNFDGDMLINEVRVPKQGDTLYTYYETLGWRGRAAGYAGIQSHPKAHLYIFSIWDHKDHSAPIRAEFRGPGTETIGFGGEGTGLKSWNFSLGWDPDVWYTLVSRCWPVGDHTYFAFWSRAGNTGKWTHLVTMDVAVKDARFRGRTDVFLEDWLSSGDKLRTTHVRGGWKRKLDGSWFALSSARYSVNKRDLQPGKRSFNQRLRWNGGVSQDASGKFYFMTAGGEKTRPTTENPSTHAIARNDQKPGFAGLKITKLESAATGKGSLVASWSVAETGCPQFGYEFELVDAAGKVIASKAEVKPHARSVEIAVPANVQSAEKVTGRLTLTDILDRKISEGS